MFQSTPDLINRENAKMQTNANDNSAFQSTPDLINRENKYGDAGSSKSRCFNPLPI